MDDETATETDRPFSKYTPFPDYDNSEAGIQSPRRCLTAVECLHTVDLVEVRIVGLVEGPGPGSMYGGEVFEVGTLGCLFHKRSLDRLRRCSYGSPQWVLAGIP